MTTAAAAPPRRAARPAPTPAVALDVASDVAIDDDVDRLLKRLHLANTRRVWRDLLVRAEHEEWTYEYLLTVPVTEEIAQRQQTRLARLARRAGFPFLKTIDDFDFTYQSTVRLALLGSALSPDFVTEGRALILVGKPGRGKTHLAIAIAYRAIQNGFDARFVTAAELIDDLSASFRAGRLADARPAYTHPAVRSRSDTRPHLPGNVRHAVAPHRVTHTGEPTRPHADRTPTARRPHADRTTTAIRFWAIGKAHARNAAVSADFDRTICHAASTKGIHHVASQRCVNVAAPDRRHLRRTARLRRRQ